MGSAGAAGGAAGSAGDEGIAGLACATACIVIGIVVVAGIPLNAATFIGATGGGAGAAPASSIPISSRIDLGENLPLSPNAFGGS